MPVQHREVIYKKVKRFQAIGFILNIMQACKRHIANKETVDEISSGLETCLRKCLMQLAK